MREDVFPMNCAQFAEVLHDLDRPGTPGMELRERALTHAEACDRCAQILTQSEALDFSLQGLGVQYANQRAPERVEEALIQEFRRVKAESGRQRLLRGVAVLGVAAAVLLALGISLRHVPAGTRIGVAGQDEDASQASVARPAAEEPSTQARSAIAGNNSEYASNYVPLPYADDPQTLEGGAIVRVVLTRPALAALGFPVVDMGTAEQIPADIMLSEDGAPQAIRLLSQASVN
jgi:hypothetical protein